MWKAAVTFSNKFWIDADSKVKGSLEIKIIKEVKDTLLPLFFVNNNYIYNVTKYNRLVKCLPDEDKVVVTILMGVVVTLDSVLLVGIVVVIFTAVESELVEFTEPFRQFTYSYSWHLTIFKLLNKTTDKSNRILDVRKKYLDMLLLYIFF